MKLRHKLTLLFASLVLIHCQANKSERIKIPPFLDIPRVETNASIYIEDIRSENGKYRVIIFNELFPTKDTLIDEQNRILDNYIATLEQTGWEFFGTIKNPNIGLDKVWQHHLHKQDCSVTIKLRLIDYYKEIGDVYFGIESHDRIQFQLTEDLSTPCAQRIPSKSYHSSPTK